MSLLSPATVPRAPTPPAAPSASPWQPLLDGARAERALQAVRDVARDLRARPAGDRGEFALGAGAAGCSVFFRYAAEVLGDEALADASLEELEDAIARLAEPGVRLDLYSGASGVGMAVEYVQDPRLRGGGAPDPDDDPNADVDDAVLEALGADRWLRRLDLIDGLAGLGVYALARLHRPAGPEMLRRVLHHLQAHAVHDARGISWRIPAHLLDAARRDRFPGGCHDLGVAHGMPGIVGLLAQAYAAGVEPATVAPLLEGGVDWLLAVRNAPGNAYTYPKFLDPDGRFLPSRLAWCYGDTGVAAVLLSAAAAAGRPAWRDAAVRIAREAAGRDPAAQGIEDAGLCHGAAGLGHLYNRMFQAAGDEALRDAALFWFDEALARHRTPAAPLGGFRAWAPVLSTSGTPWMDMPGLLMGSAGVGLALAAAAGTLEPAWDLVLLASIANPRQGIGHP